MYNLTKEAMAVLKAMAKESIEEVGVLEIENNESYMDMCVMCVMTELDGETVWSVVRELMNHDLIEDTGANRYRCWSEHGSEYRLTDLAIQEMALART